MSSRYLHLRVVGCLVAAAATGCSQESLPYAQRGMQDAVVEFVVDEPVELRLASAVIEPETSTLQGSIVSLEAEGDGSTRVSGDSSTWDLESGEVSFEGNVHFSRGDLQMKCDRLQGVYRGDELTSATATGRIGVQKGEVNAQGAIAVWDATAGSITLTGNPVVEDGGRTLRGKQITLFIDQRRLECEACSLVIADLKNPE